MGCTRFSTFIHLERVKIIWILSSLWIICNEVFTWNQTSLHSRLKIQKYIKQDENFFLNKCTLYMHGINHVYVVSNSYKWVFILVYIIPNIFSIKDVEQNGKRKTLNHNQQPSIVIDFYYYYHYIFVHTHK